MRKWTGTIVAGVLAGVISLWSLPALAGPWGPGGDRWGHRPGHYAGRLTPGEFRHLRHQQHRIHNARSRMWADGHLDRRERGRLHRMRQHHQHQAYRYRHNYRQAAWQY